MYRFVLCCCFILACLPGLGCTEAGPKLPSMVEVKGAVTLDGQPMKTGEIVFTVEGQAPQVIPVAAGAYTGKAMVGKNKVAVHSYKLLPPTSGLPTDKETKVELVADKFSSQSTLVADVPASGLPSANFDVTSK